MRDKKIVLAVEHIDAPAVVGGQINLTMKEAKAIYKMTELKPRHNRDDEEARHNLEMCRAVLRNMVKPIVVPVIDIHDVHAEAIKLIEELQGDS